jgi:AraC-like DNA-binding protein
MQIKFVATIATLTLAAATLFGYLSEAAFQRAFKQYMRMTPALWRRTAHSTRLSSFQVHSRRASSAE